MFSVNHGIAPASLSANTSGQSSANANTAGPRITHYPGLWITIPATLCQQSNDRLGLVIQGSRGGANIHLTRDAKQYLDKKITRGEMEPPTIPLATNIHVNTETGQAVWQWKNCALLLKSAEFSAHFPHLGQSFVEFVLSALPQGTRLALENLQNHRHAAAHVIKGAWKDYTARKPALEKGEAVRRPRTIYQPMSMGGVSLDIAIKQLRKQNLRTVIETLPDNHPLWAILLVRKSAKVMGALRQCLDGNPHFYDALETLHQTIAAGRWEELSHNFCRYSFPSNASRNPL